MNEKRAKQPDSSYGRLFSDLDRRAISHDIPLTQSLTQSKALTVFNSGKAQRGEGATEESSEAGRGWFTKFQ